MARGNLGIKGFISLKRLPGSQWSPEEVRTGAQTGAEAGNMEEGCSLAGSPWVLNLFP